MIDVFVVVVVLLRTMHIEGQVGQLFFVSAKQRLKVGRQRSTNGCGANHLHSAQSRHCS